MGRTLDGYTPTIIHHRADARELCIVCATSEIQFMCIFVFIHFLVELFMCYFPRRTLPSELFRMVRGEYGGVALHVRAACANGLLK